MNKKVNNLHTYLWVGKNKQGVKIRGEISALNPNAAWSKLQFTGIKVLKVKRKTQISLSFVRQKIGAKDIVFFSRYLSTMISAKIPLVQSLDIISQSCTNKAMQALLGEIRSDVEGGDTLTDALKKHPDYFDGLYCGLIHAGEQSGTLETMLHKIAAHVENVQALKSKFKRACVYPIAILCTAFGVAVFMLLFVVPRFESLFTAQGAELPIFTRMVIVASKFFQAYWLLLLICLVGLIIGFHYLKKKSPSFRHLLDVVVLKLPIFGALVKKVIFARFARTLAITLTAGIPIIDALELVKDVVKNSIYTNTLAQIKIDVAEGQQMNFAMNVTHLFPSMMVQMVEIGEKTAATNDMLNKVADYYEEEVDAMVSNMSSLLEPFILLILGGIVAILVIAMYLPIFKLGGIF